MTNISFNQDFVRYIRFVLRHPYQSLKRLKMMRYDDRPGYLAKIPGDQENGTSSRGRLINRLSQSFVWSDMPHPVPSKFRIKLAGTELEKFDCVKIDWFEKFSDAEDVAALHRFTWMYRLMTEGYDSDWNKGELLQLIGRCIESWIDEVESRSRKDLHTEIWHPYTVSERIVNWTICLFAAGGSEMINKKIWNSAARQLEYLDSRLEFFGDELTCNHLSNNGRGLYIGGLALGINYYAAIGKSILVNEAKRLVQDEIFLREGSSHYQFLITRNYAEVLWFAKAYEDMDTVNSVSPIVRRLMDGCWFFLRQNEDKIWDFPLFGDISPDYDPQWLAGVPWAAAYLLEGKTYEKIPDSPGWHTLLCRRNSEGKAAIPIPDTPQGIYTDWGKAFVEGWQLFSHVNRERYPCHSAGHCHFDTGGICLYHRQVNLLADCGRVNYTEEGDCGKNWTGHTILAVDDRNPSPIFKRYYPKEYLDEIAGPRPQLREETAGIGIYHNGYWRLRGVDALERHISLKKREACIEDIIKGRGKHKISLLFHIPHVLSKKGNKYYFMAENRIYYFEFPSEGEWTIFRGANNSPFGLQSRSYGKREAITTVRIDIQAVLPSRVKTIITCEE